MWKRVHAAWQLLRPSAIAGIRTDLRELSKAQRAARKDQHEIKKDLLAVRTALDLARSGAAKTQARLDKIAAHEAGVLRKMQRLSDDTTAITATISTIAPALATLARQTEQLMLIAKDRPTKGIDVVAAKEQAVRRIAAAPIEPEPFPHVVVDDLLPDDAWRALVAAIPPRVFFEDREVNKQQLAVPPLFAPESSKQVWSTFLTQVIDGALRAAVIEKFRAPLEEYIGQFWPNMPADDPALSLVASDGRIILRRPGNVLAPHRDPKWGFLTFILYLARPGDPEAYGTQLYRMSSDEEAPSLNPLWVDKTRCELVKDVPFRANRALIFLNSHGAHGSSISPDAPAAFERYIYQWRIGPSRAGVQRLMAQLSPARRALWEGKFGDTTY